MNKDTTAFWRQGCGAPATLLHCCRGDERWDPSGGKLPINKYHHMYSYFFNLEFLCLGIYYNYTHLQQETMFMHKATHHSIIYNCKVLENPMSTLKGWIVIKCTWWSIMNLSKTEKDFYVKIWSDIQDILLNKKARYKFLYVIY